MIKNNIIKEKYKYSKLSSEIIGAAMEVHKFLGNGFQEIIYQRALAIELKEKKLSFIREQEMQIEYKGIDIGTRRVDFFIENKIMLEIKAVIQLEDVHLAQAINYLEAYDLENISANVPSRFISSKALENSLHNVFPSSVD